MYMNYLTLKVIDVELKNQILCFVEEQGIVDLDALVTQEQLEAFGFVNATNLYVPGIYIL